MQYSFSMLLTILSIVVYHISQKNTPANAHPLLNLAFTYVISALFCVVLLLVFFQPSNVKSPLDLLNQISWSTSIFLSLSVVGAEIGFLLAYRFGWAISLGALISNVAATLILLPLGTVLYAEKLATSQFFGIGICILGLILATYKEG